MHTQLCAGFLIALLTLPFGVSALGTGERAPPWTLLTIEGTEIDFPRIAAGRPAMVLLLAERCGDCAQLLQSLQGLREEHARHQLEIYAIAPGDVFALLGDAARDTDLVLLPDGAEVAAGYAPAELPWLVLVDQQGIVRWAGSPAERDAAFDAALGMVAPP